MCNVIEHVQDAIAVLHNVWAALRPGGLLMFSERAWPTFDYRASDKLNNQLHPVRIAPAVLEAFIAHFEVLHIVRRADGTPSEPDRIVLFFIGRKRARGGTKLPPPVWDAPETAARGWKGATAASKIRKH